jgi:uncharacterized membrane protein YgdD (TMEM256/DUF423 family)
MVGAVSVALGAFGAHGLQKAITDPKSIKVSNPAPLLPLLLGLGVH